MSTKMTLAQLSALGIEVVTEAPAKETLTVTTTEVVPEGTHRNAAGRLVDANGKFVKDPSKGAASKPASKKPASKKGKKAAEPKPESEAVEVVKLQKSTRALFVAAHPQLKGLSTKAVAVAVVKGEVELLPGFVVGDGYRKVAAESIANA